MFALLIGAGILAGVLMLAVLAVASHETLARVSAAKNVVTGMANAVAGMFLALKLATDAGSV